MYIQDKIELPTKREYTPEGFLKVPARISRTGIQSYTAAEMGLTDRPPKSLIRVYRSADEVFKPESLASFADKPVTNDHPPVLLDASNAKRYSVGHAGPEVTKDGECVSTSLFITDKTTIDAIENGKVELSNGYLAEIEWRSGQTQLGEEYDAVQTNIFGNHIAVVDRGRAGPACRVADNMLNSNYEETNVKITIDGVDYEVPEQAGQAVSKVLKKLADTEEKLKEKEDEMEEKDEEMKKKEKEAKENTDALQAKLDEATSAIPTAEQLDTMASDRATLLSNVSKVAPNVDCAGKNLSEIQTAVLKDAHPDLDLEGKSPEYISARFDAIMESAPEANKLDNAIGSTVKDKQGTEDKDNRPADQIARDNMIERNKTAWNPNSTGDK